MREFVGTDELKGARFVGCDLTGAEFRGVVMSRVTITDALLRDADISGDLTGTTINGVEVGPLVEVELDRLHPERLRLRPTDVAGVRAALDVVEAMWSPTLERGRALGRELLHERVGGEYSFVETQRHLLFAVDAWVVRMVLQVPRAYHEWDVPPDLALDAPPDTGPELDEVMAVRHDRWTRIRAWLDGSSDADLGRSVSPPDSDGHPQGEHRVLSCLQVMFNEEWWHHQYATRDLAALEARAAS